MEHVLSVVVALTAVSGVLVLRGWDALPKPARYPAPASPLDEAERILARRYARGQITFDEYDHMISILRR